MGSSVERRLKSVKASWIVMITIVLGGVGCGEKSERIPPDSVQRYPNGTITPITEPYPTTNQNYSLTRAPGTMTVAQLLATISTKEKFSWYGLSSAENARRQTAQCGPFSNRVDVLPQLPATIQGVVTSHPRYFKKTSFCGFDSRNYGSFWIQDETGGILVIRDSRIADFDIGQQISLVVRGVARLYGLPMILIPDDIKIINTTPTPIYTQQTTIPDIGQHVGEVVTTSGVVVEPPTSENFNTICMIPQGGDASVCEGTCLRDKSCKTTEKVYLSIDREIGQRNPKPIAKGDRLKVTGPVTLGFSGLEIVVAKIGQYEIIK